MGIEVFISSEAYKVYVALCKSPAFLFGACSAGDAEGKGYVFQDSKPGAVSYTHLDVYKRQSGYRPWDNHGEGRKEQGRKGCPEQHRLDQTKVATREVSLSSW